VLTLQTISWRASLKGIPNFYGDYGGSLPPASGVGAFLIVAPFAPFERDHAAMLEFFVLAGFGLSMWSRPA
jgi:hypothetical protein